MTLIDLDIMGRQMSTRNTYTNISYIFALNENVDLETRAFMIRTSLTEGLQRLAGSFPWIAGQNLYSSIQTFGQVPLFQTGIRLDLSLDAFLQANWSMNLLDPEVYVPQPPQDTPPGAARTLGSPIPVFMVKVVIISGAVVLTFSANNGAFDITGQVTMIRLLSKACRGEAFTEDDVRLASRNLRIDRSFTQDKAPVNFRLDAYRRLKRTDVPLAPSYHSPPPTLTWAYFLANVSSLEAIKTRAQSNSLSLSTDDVLTALIWKSISISRCLDGSTESFLIRAVNVREAFGVPNTYVGMFQYLAFHKLKVLQLGSMSLENLAIYLRDQLAPDTLNPFMRVIAALTYRVTWESPTFKFIWPNQDVHVTSWAEMDCYSQDFGFGLGDPINVLQPCLPAMKDGDVHFMPQTPEGNIMISVCLTKEIIDNLKINQPFMEFVQVMG